MDAHGKHQDLDDGFTLVELLVVIVTLGVLATITVFAVRGITNQGHESARAADEKTLIHAEEAHQARFNSYASEDELVTAGLLTSESAQHDINVEAGGASYTVVPAGTGTTIPAAPEPTTPPAPEPTVPTVPTTPATVPPTVAVPTSYAGFNGQSFGTGSNRIVVISDGTAMAPEWNAFAAAGVPLATTEIIWLGTSAINSTDDVDAIVAAGPAYIVAGRSVPIDGPQGQTFVGQYLDDTGLSPSRFWWGHMQGGFNAMLAHYTSAVVPGG
ncbi:MAG: prepilin-type N-terminal cleavage/methylation domain-containing protein [Ilumatobacteraceae bacterium]